MEIKKVKAVTIIELVVAMLISSIVIGIVFYALSIFNNQFINYRDKSGKLNVFFLFKKAITNDFAEADMIKDSMQNLVLYREYKPTQCIIYNFKQDNIIRFSPAGTDTFQLKNNGLLIQRVEDSLFLVKNVSINVNLGKEVVGLIVNKAYSSEQLLKAETSINE